MHLLKVWMKLNWIMKCARCPLKMKSIWEFKPSGKNKGIVIQLHKYIIISAICTKEWKRIRKREGNKTCARTITRNAFNDLMCRCCISFHFHCSKGFCLLLYRSGHTNTHTHSPSNNIFSHSMYISVLIIHYLFLLLVRSIDRSFCTFLFPPFGKLFRICATNSI